MKNNLFKYYAVVLSIVFSLLASVSLLTPGIPPTHDGEYHILRFSQFYKVLSSGNLYPRWAPDFNNGFGIPLFNYVYPLPNYNASMLHFFGFSFIDSFKLSMIIATLIGSVFIYLWAKEHWGNQGALVSSVFYTFSPYHLLDIYVRGSVGEVWSLGLFPGLLWSYLIFRRTKKFSFFVLSCIFLALVIFSHNILAVIFFLFFTLYSGFLILNTSNKKRELFQFFLISIIGFSLSSPFWLPALIEAKYVQGLQIFDVTKNFPEIYQLIVPSWGYGLSPSDFLNPMSVQIGIANLFVFFMSFIVLLKTKKKNILLFFILCFMGVFFLMTPYTAFIWKNFPLFSYFQFPWRFLSLEILIASLLAGSIVPVFENKRVKTVAVFLLITIAVGLSLGYSKGATYYNRNDKYYLARSNFTDGTNSVGNVFNTKWFNSIPKKQKEKIFLVKGNGTLKIGEIRPDYYKMQILSKTDTRWLINTAYFPGWSVFIDNKESSLRNFDGKMIMDVPKGNHAVGIKFTDTVVRKISFGLFLSAWGILVVLANKRTGIIS